MSEPTGLSVSRSSTAGCHRSLFCAEYQLHPFHGFDAEQAQASAQDSGGHVTQDEAGVLHDAF
jgi:hypothetical protein